MDKSKVVFHALDRDAEIELSERNLPHWFQVDAAMFITFRTADSLPKEVVLRWHRELQEWLESQLLPATLADSVLTPEANELKSLLGLFTEKQQKEFKRQKDLFFHRSLDDCHGACLMKYPDVAKVVANALVHFAGQRYDLDCFVIMPNHVHAIAQFREGFDPTTVSQSWMRFTARTINQMLGREGVLWQPEPFDHIIRSSVQFEYLQTYIQENPTKAKLRSGEYYFWNG